MRLIGNCQVAAVAEGPAGRAHTGVTPCSTPREIGFPLAKFPRQWLVCADARAFSSTELSRWNFGRRQDRAAPSRPDCRVVGAMLSQCGWQVSQRLPIGFFDTICLSTLPGRTTAPFFFARSSDGLTSANIALARQEREDREKREDRENRVDPARRSLCAFATGESRSLTCSNGTRVWE